MIPRLGEAFYGDRTQVEETIGHEKDLAIKGNVLIVEGRLLDSRTVQVEDRLHVYKTIIRQYE